MRPGPAAVHGAQHLDVVDRIEAEAPRYPFGHQLPHARGGRVGVVGGNEIEVGRAFRLSQPGNLAGVHAVGVRDDPAAGRLPELLREPDHRQGLRCNQVAQHLARSDGRKLIDVPHDQHRRFAGHRADQRVHQRDVDHRRLVDDNQVGVDGTFLVALEPPGGWVDFEQPVDGLGRQTGRLAEAARGAARRRAERYGEPSRGEDGEQGIDHRRLADARPPGHHQHLGDEGAADRVSLAGRELQAGSRLDPAERQDGIDLAPGHRPGRERTHPAGDCLLRLVERRQEEAVGAAHRVGHDRPFRPLVIYCRSYEVRGGLEQFGRLRQQLFRREAAVTVRQRFEECEADAGLDANRRRLLDTEAHRQGVGGPEADAADVARELVRVLRHHADRVAAVGLVDAHRARRPDPVLVQKDHDLADRSLLGPRFANPRGADRADPFDVAQAVRLGVDHVEDRGAERVHQLRGVDRTDAVDQAGGEIPLDSLLRGGLGRLQEAGPELRAVVPIVNPVAGAVDPLAGSNEGGAPHDRDRAAPAARPHPQDREAVVRVVEGHALHGTGDDLVVGGARSGGLWHAST